MSIINLHMLQAHPVSLLNRDDTGSAKGVTFGNVRRDRLSSQSAKRAIREQLRTTAIDGGVWGQRTKRLPSQVINILTSTYNRNPDAADAVVGALFTAMKFKRADNGNTAATIFASSTAPDELAALADTHFDALLDGTADTTVTAAAIASLDVDATIDLALFGRMLAELPTGRVDGAVGVAHAYGVTPSSVEPDFFTLVDDCAPDGEPASGNLGITDLTSPIFYRYLYLDTKQLAHNLAAHPKLTEPATAAFLRNAVTAVPSAKSRNAASHTRPDLVVATIGDSNLSAGNAYTRAITDDTPMLTAMGRLFTQLDYATRVQPHTTIALPLTQDAETAATAAGVTIAANMDEFIALIAKA